LSDKLPQIRDRRYPDKSSIRKVRSAMNINISGKGREARKRVLTQPDARIALPFERGYTPATLLMSQGQALFNGKAQLGKADKPSFNDVMLNGFRISCYCNCLFCGGKALSIGLSVAISNCKPTN
jgi:hypothetical protein